MVQLPRQKTNRDAGPWTELGSKDRIRQVSTPNFEAFFEFVNAGFGDQDEMHIWRGQRNSEWQIRSKLARMGKSKGSFLQEYRNAVARCTKVEYDISDQNPRSEETRLRLWSLGQHHGLATPLIDWTLYPFVALFFAFAEESTESEFRAVFALDWEEVARVNFLIKSKRDYFRKGLEKPPYSDELKSDLEAHLPISKHPVLGDLIATNAAVSIEWQNWLISMLDSSLARSQLNIFESQAHENPRIHSQGGRHVVTPDDRSIESWITENGNNVGDRDARIPILTKILIPSRERSSVLRGLNRMNVNYLSLFPDFEGAARHCNLLLQEGPIMRIRPY